MTGLNGFNFNNVNQNNPLMDYLRQYIPQQQSQSAESFQQSAQEQQRNNVGIATFEINAKSDLEYVEPEKSGRLQMVYCRPEKRVYVGRYNFARQEMDWEAFLSEGEIKLSQSPDTSAEMSQIAQALVAVVNKLESMDIAINEIKNTKPKIIEKIIEKPVEIKEVPSQSDAKSSRDSSGRFIKKGGK